MDKKTFKLNFTLKLSNSIQVIFQIIIVNYGRIRHVMITTFRSTVDLSIGRPLFSDSDFLNTKKKQSQNNHLRSARVLFS